jgi:dipeptide/tripeptide permease
MSTEKPDEIYQAVTRIFGAVIAVFGVVILVVTLANGGTAASSGFWLGLIFIGLGAGRLYLALRRP